METFTDWKLKRRRVIAAVVAAGGLFFGAFYFWYRLGDNRGYSPDQPIPFSHRLHAGDLKIDCQYCHASVDRSRHATVPGTETCMNCHAFVKKESPHIQKMAALAKEGKTPEWIKIHDMPDFVFFSHKRHIAKGVACETCHGNIRGMIKVSQVQQLNMGFCIECHRENEAPTSCDICHH